MNGSFWNRRIPTLAGLLFLLVGIITTSLFTQRGTSLLTRADSNTDPQNIKVTNLSDTSATVSFTTASLASTTLSYGQGNTSSQTITDVRDKGSAPIERQTHYFTLTNLQPNSTYSFTITSNGEKHQNNSTAFQFTTAPVVTFTNTNDHVISGKVIRTNGEIAKDVILYITSDATQEFSVLTGIDGGFSLPVQNVRNSDLSQALSLTATTPLSILATNGTEESSASFLFGNADPLPTISLSNSYDFSVQPKLMPQTTTASNSASVAFPLSSISLPGDPEILTPKKDEQLLQKQPTFSGIAKANETVSIEIGSTEKIQAKVLTTRQGKWSYRPTKPLVPGKYTLRVTANRENGNPKTILQPFTIAGIAPVPSPTATPKASPTPTKIISTPTPTVTQRPSPTPTKIVVAPSVTTTKPLTKLTAEDISPTPEVSDPTLLTAADETYVPVAQTAVLAANNEQIPTPTEMVLMSRSSTLPTDTDPVMISISIAMFGGVGLGASLFLLKRDTLSV